MLLHLAINAPSGLRRCRSPCCMSTPATTCRKSSTSATTWWPSTTCACTWPASRSTSRTVASPSAPTVSATRCRPCRAGRDLREPLRRRLRWRSPRRGAGPRQGADLLAAQRFRSVGTPRGQRPELWNLYNGRHSPGEQVRVFPLSNFTELDIWRYIARDNVELASIYYATSVRCTSATACG